MARKKKVETSFDGESIAADASQIGKSSNELPLENVDSGKSESRLAEILKTFTVFDSFLLISLICISLATIRLIFAISQYGSVFAKPWSIP